MVKLCVAFAILIYFAGASPTENQNNFLQNRIINGTKAARRVPYMVSLQPKSSTSNLCGGAVLNERWIITAAHCVNPKKATWKENTVIRVGNNDLRGQSDVYKIEKVIQHPEWKYSSYPYDIALLKVALPIKIDHKRVDAIALDEAIVGANQTAEVCGWGSTNFKGGSTNHLQCLKQTVISYSICRNTYGFPVIDKKQICALSPRNSLPYAGDSGSPLVRNNKLIGVASTVAYKEPMGKPAVYIRVSSYRSWIQEVMKTN